MKEKNIGKNAKSIALKTVNERLGLNLNDRNVTFSGVVPASNGMFVWWFEPNNLKFKNGFYLILDKPEEKKYLLFFIPPNEINNPKALFRQRKENNRSQSHIEIEINDTGFVDRLQKKISFKKYFKRGISYEGEE